LFPKEIFTNNKVIVKRKVANMSRQKYMFNVDVAANE